MDRYHVVTISLLLLLLCSVGYSQAPVKYYGDPMGDYVEFNIIVLKPDTDETSFVAQLREWLARCYELENCKMVELITPMNLVFSSLGIDHVEALPRHYGWIKVWDSRKVFDEMLENQSEEYKEHVDFLHNQIYSKSVIVSLHYAQSYAVGQ